ncbi:unnamed protein product [Microthlaspi erraticum]|uniref:Uncharacterized protein n=1 Tax=Microthlaspi erraticum TaxID=1685480 RepID=A0A6D2L255_9BRAS|nr:unnamed protein product [Microthlaspi erraticum]
MHPTLPIYSVLIAFMQFLTVICSLVPRFTLVVDIVKSSVPDLWQFGLNFLDMSNPFVILVEYSLMEFSCLPKFLLVLSDFIAGSWSSKVSNTSLRVGSVTWCFVAIEFQAVSLVAKFAVAAFSTPGLGSMKVSKYSQGTTSLLLVSLSVAFALIHVVFVFIPACNAVFLAGLALLSCSWNNSSFNGE